MYPHRLDTPPPVTQFRRPWSPEPFDRHANTAEEYRNTYHNTRARTASDLSVEALDLNDYAMTLRRPDLNNNHPPFDLEDPYLESPPPLHTYSIEDTIQRPPSFGSAGSSMRGHSHPSYPSPRTPLRRPFSLPPVREPWNQPLSQHVQSRYDFNSDYCLSATPTRHVNVSNFPEWSRAWYEDQKKPHITTHPLQSTRALDVGVASLDFDPKVYPSTNGSHRDLLPWLPEDTPSASGITAEVKEERLKMLEDEFGGQSRKDRHLTEHTVGSVDQNGNIVTAGPKKRILSRWTQGLFALGAAIASLYSAIILKPKGIPPPRGKPPAYILYFLSVITFLLILYLFVFRPCCCAGKRQKPPSHEGPGGLMVLPVQSLPGGANAKKKKRGNGGRQGSSNDVQVNLIVDPSMFGHTMRDQDGESDSEAAIESRHSRHPKRRGVFEGLAMERQWRQGRSFMKWLLFFDIVSMVVWGAEFVLILMGSRCPAGKYEGWCDGYNVATTLSCFISVVFGLSVFFDIKDLHSSRISPRTRP